MTHACFQIKVIGKSLIHIIKKRPGMRCGDVLKNAGLSNYELLVETDDFPVEPDETLDFVEPGQVLYAGKIQSDLNEKRRGQ